MQLEELQPQCAVEGVYPDGPVTVLSVQWYGSEALELTYKTPFGVTASDLLYREDEDRLRIHAEGRPWSFDGDGALFRLASEARRIRLAYLFDPVLAVHTSQVEPLPHQITAVYQEMLPRQPLRFLLADDPGAGKTIMAGLLIKELIARGDLERCLIVCPGSLAEQWRDELYNRFQLPFEILTNDKLRAAHTGNWFLEARLVIARLDKLSRDEDVQLKLQAPDAAWDLVVCDEAHKMSATYFGGEIKYTKRYRLGQLLSKRTRNFLLMTATPHNGKEEDFQLFMGLLDPDRFEGRFRDGVHIADASDLMRRMVKERLLKFDGKPLFPERIAHTIPYKLSDREADLYESVTTYVREEFDRAEALQNAKGSSAVGFALTILQRRLASSPAAIYRSLSRRRERLKSRLEDFESLRRGESARSGLGIRILDFDVDEIDDLEDAPAEEVEEIQDQLIDAATAAKSIVELKAELETLKRLEALALGVLRSGGDAKWQQLASLVAQILVGHDRADSTEASPSGGLNVPIPDLKTAGTRKLVIFTEHRDTLGYLSERIRTLIGRESAVVVIDGSVGRDQRLAAQEAFRHDPNVQVLLATDAAGEGINLQRAHLMVNYDLPWNPNRLEQRFGRIHRIGQTEVCHLWNLVADETREGDVYARLLEKLDLAREALGGQVFDVLGKLEFQGKPLRELLLEAIRYGERPEVRDWLNTALENALDVDQITDLLEEGQIAVQAMDATRLRRVREDMERAEARRLQPHYIESFFLEAYKRLGGTARQREARRYQVTHVPAHIRNRHLATATGEPILSRYERIAFDKNLVAAPGRPPASFVCPGHPLLESVVDLTLDQHRDLLKCGATLVDDRDHGTSPRVLFFVEHALRDGSITDSGERRIISKRVLYIEIQADGVVNHLHYAPYLDYRPLRDDEPSADKILERSECAWISKKLEQQAQAHAVSHAVPAHLSEVRRARLELIDKTEAAVKSRLTKEINYWDRRADELREAELADKTNARLNSDEARKRADAMQVRLEQRLQALQRDRQISPMPPVVIGGLLVVPKGLVDLVAGRDEVSPVPTPDTQASAARAREAVMETERRLGFEPTDRELEKLGYDIESRVPETGSLRFIEVKGRVSDADDITVTRNEILTALNKPEEFILAIVLFRDTQSSSVHYVRRPFGAEPDFGVTSVKYNLGELLAKAEEPR